MAGSQCRAGGLTDGVVVLVVFPAGGRGVAAAAAERPKTREAIGRLRVAAPLSMQGYSRKRFPHWVSQGEGCDTRELVLQRDGTRRRRSTPCRSDVGPLAQLLRRQAHPRLEPVDIDHIVPLANAWIRGARALDAPAARRVRQRPARPAADRRQRAPRTAPRATARPTSGSRRGARRGACTRAGG